MNYLELENIIIQIKEECQNFHRIYGKDRIKSLKKIRRLLKQANKQWPVKLDEDIEFINWFFFNIDLRKGVDTAIIRETITPILATFLKCIDWLKQQHI